MEDSALVGLLEAIYSLELDDQGWLMGVLTAAMAACGSEHTYLGFFYDASDVEALKVWNVCALELPPEVAESFHVFQEQAVGPGLVRMTLRSLRAGSARKTGMPYMEPVLAYRSRTGWGDIFNVNALEPSGIGCLLTLGVRDREFLTSAREMAAYKRISHHLAAAFRCRRRLGATQPPPRVAEPLPIHTGAEAILDSEGRFAHAEGEAAGKSARERIRAAANAIDVLRARRRTLGRAAIDTWHPLVSARWTLVDSFEENGRRYVVAQENQAMAPGFDILTDRERQVVLQAALGSTTKEIAYALGISDSTVRVLMARAVNRIGVRSRAELLSHPSLQGLRADQSGEHPVALSSGSGSGSGSDSDAPSSRRLSSERELDAVPSSRSSPS